MDILERIIENLTSDEVRRFKILSNRFKADEEKKLLILFDAVRAGNFEEYEEELIRNFYGDTEAKSKNSYYRLRNKLLSNIEKSLLFYHFNYKNTLEAYSNIQLALLYHERGLHKEASYSLKKAEKVAIAHDQFNLLEVIYDDMLRMATNTDIDIEKVLNRRRENQQKVELMRSTAEILAVITSELQRRNYSRSRRSESILETLEGIKQRLDEHKQIFQSVEGKFTVAKTVFNILLQKTAYSELAEYAKETLEDFENNGLFDQLTHSKSLQIRVWRINSLLKLLDLETANEELEKLLDGMEMYDNQNFNQWSFFYYSAKAYYYKLTGNLDESYNILKEALKNKECTSHERNQLYLRLSLADLYFSRMEHDKSADELDRIISLDHFSKIGEEIRLYIYIFEIVNSYEMGEHERADEQYRNLKKNFKQLLKDDFYIKPRKFVDIVIRMNQAAQEGRKVFLKSAFKSFDGEFAAGEFGDNSVILYDVYLRSKLEQRPYYRLLLEEVARRRHVTDLHIRK